MTRALLVGLTLNETLENTEYSLLELTKLAKVLDILIVDQIIQKHAKINQSSFIGSGKILEIKKIIPILDIELIIFDTTLSSAQLRNLERVLEVEIMDRSFLILQIFAKRAQSKEAKLEVSLAQKEYMLPRLIGINKSLSRQGGSSFNAKGPGETKLELDRRKLTNQITTIKRELQLINIKKETNKKQRIEHSIKTVALIGYTNAGKSSTMNSLVETLSSNKEIVLAKDQVFSTLDTKVKRLKKENYPPFLLVDTVGFISKLPPELVSSFKSTLSDSLDADLILQIVDATADIEKEIQVTNEILMEIGADKIERLLIFTKKDLAVLPPVINFDYCFISNKTKEGIDKLIMLIYQNILKDDLSYELKIPYQKGSLLNDLKNNNLINSIQYLDDYILVSAVLSAAKYAKLLKKLTV